MEVVNDLFEEQTDLEKIVRKIMHRAQTLLKCERCSVQLLEDIESPVLCLSVCTFVHVHVCSFCLPRFLSVKTVYFHAIFPRASVISSLSNFSGGEVHQVV